MNTTIFSACIGLAVAVGSPAVALAQGAMGESTAAAADLAPKLLDAQTRYDAVKLLIDAMDDTRKKAEPRQKALSVYLERTGTRADYLAWRGPAPEPGITYELAIEKALKQVGTSGPVVPVSNDLDTIERTTRANENLARKQLEETVVIAEESARMEAFVKESGKWEDFVEFVNQAETPEGKAARQAAKQAEIDAQKERVAVAQTEQANREAVAARKRQENAAQYQRNLQATQQAANHRAQYFYRNSSFSNEHRYGYYDSW